MRPIARLLAVPAWLAVTGPARAEAPEPVFRFDLLDLHALGQAWISPPLPGREEAPSFFGDEEDTKVFWPHRGLGGARVELGLVGFSSDAGYIPEESSRVEPRHYFGLAHAALRLGDRFGIGRADVRLGLEPVPAGRERLMAPDRLFFQGPSVATERSTPGTALGGTVDLHFDVGLRVRAGFYDDSRQPWREGSLRPLAVLRAEWSKGSLDRLGGIASQTAYAFGTDVWLETAHGTHTSGEGLDAVLRNWRFAVYSEIRHLRERVGTDEPRDQIAATGQVSYTQPLPLGSLEVAARAAIFDEDLDLPGVHQGQVVEVGLVWHSPWELADVGVGYIRRDETKQDEIRDDTVRVWLQLQRRRIWKGHVEDTPHGRWPSNEVPVTFGPSPLAPAEMLKDFDAILIPGCPSRPRGAPSRCQRARVASALLLHRAGYADWFIVSGGAVQNEHNEAEALRKLLVMEGVPSRHILLEPRAEHTDENFYYTTQIMEERGWDRVLVATDGGHMLYVATCDANCCVRLGRLSSYDFPTDDGDLKAAAYELSPPSRLWTDEECRHIEQLERFMGTTLSQRKTCADLP